MWTLQAQEEAAVLRAEVGLLAGCRHALRE